MSDDSTASAGVLPLSSPSWQLSASRSLHPADSFDELPVPPSPFQLPSDSDANATSPTSADLRRQAFTFAGWSRRVATSDGEDSADESSSAASNSLGRRQCLAEGLATSPTSSSAAAAAAASAEDGTVDYQNDSWDRRRPPLKAVQSAGYAAPPSVFVFDGVQEVQIHGKGRKTCSNGLEYSSKKPKDKRKVCIAC
jgi:hypothetical protein